MMQKVRGFFRRFADLSIRTKYLLSIIVLLLALLICGAYVSIKSFNLTYSEYVDTAEGDFINCYATLTRFENRMLHLVTIFQHSQQANAILTATIAPYSGEHTRVRLSLLQFLYIMLDSSGDYDFQLYVRSALSIADATSKILDIATIQDTDWGQNALSGWGWKRFYSAADLNAHNPALIAPIRNLENYQDLIAVLRIDLNNEALVRMMNAVKSSEYVACYLETANGVFVASSDEDVQRISLDQLDQDTIGGFSAQIMTTMQWNRDTVFYQTLPESGWLFIMVVHRSQIIRDLLPQYLLLFIVGTLLALGGLFLTMPILLPITVRIRRFHQHVLGIQAGQAYTPLEPLAQDEVGQLIEAHNNMMQHLKTLIEEKERNEKEMRRLELQALQSQIKPHFLYNTLEAVSWMAQMHQSSKVQSTLRSLTTFYRLCLSQGQDVLTIGEELEIVRNYFAIQCVRYEQVFYLEVDVSVETQQLQLPKITLQPLVENALMHGILESGRNEGTIRIFERLNQHGEHELCIADTGAHFTRDAWRKALSISNEIDEGYGLYNVERRLCLFFKVPKVLHLDLTIPGLTIVSLILPKSPLSASG